VKQTIGLIFSYEELNTNVLWNSRLWNLKKDCDFNYVAYAPKGFHSLFFAADEIITIPEKFNSYGKYSQVSEYFPVRSRIKSSVHNVFCRTIRYIILKFNPTNSTLLILLRLLATDRQKEFLYSNKTFDWIRKDFKTRNKVCNQTEKFTNRKSVYRISENYLVPVQNYLKYDGNKLFIEHFSLEQDFRFLFHEHFRAISGGIGDVFQNSIFSNLNLSSQKIINIRTRNYQRKQPEHNTRLENVLNITKVLTNNNFKVINIGSPPLSLKSHLSNKEMMNYSEFGDLSLDDELKVTSGPIICNADAGLFVLVCCMPNPLVVLTEEWSSYLGISLLEARKIAGFNTDIDNLSDIQTSDYLLLNMNKYFEKKV
jgi:hypothetical protein